MKLAIGLLWTALLVALTYAVTGFDWYSPRHARLAPFLLPLFVLVGIFWALLVRWFHRKTTWIECAVIVSIVVMLECLMLPAVTTRHGPRHRAPLGAPSGNP
jgi:hypothetical protein